MSLSAAEIVFTDVTKRYPGRDSAAVRNLSLVVPAGEICVLVGPSGAGKTTAMKLVNRLIDFDEGDITIDGQSIRKLDVVELRRGIGYVIQQIGLFPHMTVGDNVAVVPRLLGWPKQRVQRPGGRAARARRTGAGRRATAIPRSSRAASASASASPARSRPTRR